LLNNKERTLYSCAPTIWYPLPR